jgi:hypothetical protein
VDCPHQGERYHGGLIYFLERRPFQKWGLKSTGAARLWCRAYSSARLTPMIRITRAVWVCLLAIALVANIAPSFAMALAAASAQHVHLAPESDHHGNAQVNRADHGGVHKGHADCPGHTENTKSGSDRDDVCNKCCGVCITASMLLVSAAPAISEVTMRASFWTPPSTLTAHRPPSDPGIPKRLT